MGVETINNNYTTQFADRLHADQQQIKSRLKKCVKMQVISNANQFAYDGIGTVEAEEVSGRNMPVVFQDITHRRRKIARRRFIVTLPIDQSDGLAVLIKPEAEYSAACVKAMERKFDRVVAEAAFASVKTGENFETTVTAANDGVITVDAHAGFTYEKLLEIVENFINNDVGLESSANLYLAITGDEHTALLKETELTSGDFVRQYSVEKGKMTNAVGLELIMFAANAKIPTLAIGSDTYRKNIAMAKDAICVGMSKDVEVKIQPRNDLVQTDQVQIVGIWGAVRTEGVLVQEVLSAPTA